MPAYMMIACRIKDREKFVAGYGAEAAKLVAKFGGEYLFVAPGAELLEGSLEGYTSVACSKWPDKAAARAFWNSPDYAEVRKLRGGIADVEVLLVETPE
ncbi:MAG: DUF1330 domain-containing protein [Pacificimonas sp.]|jgi:uncharacterized protein (DUF1330 family)|nr:DUF1330 domain-containing protein [Pacificimonas sp.]